MSDVIPKPGDKAYKKRKTLKLEGFDDEEYYAIVRLLSTIIMASSLMLSLARNR